MSNPSITFITFTGRPGSGKSTIIANLLRARGDMKIFAGKSVTTRPARTGDVAGEYEYVTLKQFEDLKNQGAFAWTALHNRHQYGTRKNDIFEALSARHISVMTLVPLAVFRLHKLIGSDRVLSFFIETQSEETLMRRMVRERKTENLARAKERLAETGDWSPRMPILRTVPMITVFNRDETPPGTTATEAILHYLEK